MGLARQALSGAALKSGDHPRPLAPPSHGLGRQIPLTYRLQDFAPLFSSKSLGVWVVCFFSFLPSR